MKATKTAIVLGSLLLTAPAFADEGLDLLKKSGCIGCHNIDKKVMGPSFKDVAAKYASDTKAHDYLVDKIKGGSKGVWGSADMLTNSPRVSDENIAKLADYILSLK
ncbi:MAG: hypothetical protein A2V90_06580 [Gammaproteobacteria bacterium RBG_16_57_12]|nr:MAG: hypothetical protein A2V90_06580 [Gammaproteobacteria bacterium RBG_16_57_12]